MHIFATTLKVLKMHFEKLLEHNNNNSINEKLMKNIPSSMIYEYIHFIVNIFVEQFSLKLKMNYLNNRKTS